MFAFLNNLGIRIRMSLSVTLFIVTLLFSLYSAWMSLGANVDFAEKEKLGNMYQRPVAAALYDAASLRISLTQKALGVNKGAEIEKTVAALSAALADLKAVQDKIGETLQFTEEGLASRGREALKYETVLAKWNALAADIQNAPNANHDAALVSLIADLRGMIAHSGDTSNLILDPDLDSYYLMDITLLALPQTIDRLSVIGSTIYPRLAQAHMMTPSDNVEHAVFASMLSESDIGRIAADFDTSFKEDANFYGKSPTYEAKIKPLFEDYKTKNAALSDMLKDLSQGKLATAPRFLSAWTQALDSSHVLLTESYNELDSLLQYRIADYKGQQFHALFVSVAGIIVSMLFYQIVVQSLITPLGALTRVMSDLADQRLEVDVPYRGVRSEMGKIAAALEVFKNNALLNRQMEQDKIVAAERAEREKNEAMRRIADSFQERVQSIIGSVAAASTELANTAELMSGSISKSTQSAQAAAEQANETVSSVQTVAAAAEEMSATIQEISIQTQKTNKLISDSVEKVGGADVFAAQLQSASQKVRDVVSLISDISGQINLLALNATIESARAGEAGKGFAVVASEVRNLAGQTDRSIQEIELVIGEMKQAADGVIAALTGIKDSVDTIQVSSTGIASAVEEQSVTVSDIAHNMSMASNQTQKVQNNIGIVSTLSGEAEYSADEVLVAARGLSQQAEMLDMAVASFLSELHG